MFWGVIKLAPVEIAPANIFVISHKYFLKYIQVNEAEHQASLQESWPLRSKLLQSTRKYIGLSR